MRIHKTPELLQGADPNCAECEKFQNFYCNDCSRAIFETMKRPDGSITCPKTVTGQYVSVIFIGKKQMLGSRAATYHYEIKPIPPGEEPDAQAFTLREVDL